MIANYGSTVDDRAYCITNPTGDKYEQSASDLIEANCEYSLC